MTDFMYRGISLVSYCLNASLLPGQKSTEQTEQHHIPTSSQDQKMQPTASKQETPPTQPTSTTVKKTQPPPTTVKAENREILKSISACDDLVGLIQVCSASGKVVTSYCKILLIDSGGQPQFHEILPVFLRQNVYLCVCVQAVR